MRGDRGKYDYDVKCVNGEIVENGNNDRVNMTMV